MQYGRSCARDYAASKSTARRIWNRNRFQPHLQNTFKYSNDPQLVEKAVDIAGLYLDPQEKALVLVVDEKSQMQALNERLWRSSRQMQEQSQAPRLPAFPQNPRQDMPGRRDPLGLGQLRHSQTPESKVTAFSSSPICAPFQTGARVLDEPGRDLVPHPHQAGGSARDLQRSDPLEEGCSRIRR